MEHTKRDNSRFAAFLLYAVSILGIINIISSAQAIGSQSKTVLPMMDLIVYAFLFVLAIFIHRHSLVARVVYAVTSVLWFAVLTFYLPWKYGHSLSVVMVFSQVSLIVIAYAILFTSPAKKVKSVTSS